MTCRASSMTVADDYNFVIFILLRTTFRFMATILCAHIHINFGMSNEILCMNMNTYVHS